MMESPSTTVNILDKEYRVSCPREEEQALQEAAHYLNEQMREIRSAGKVIGVERIAVMAALNICYELLQSRHKSEDMSSNAQEHIQQMLGKLDQALMAIES
ncbi:MAG: cell division protein ZapA [Endozoicomonas sp.]